MANENGKASVIVFDIETYSTRDNRAIARIVDEAVNERPKQNTLKALKDTWDTTESRAKRGAEAVSKTALDPMLASVLCVAYRVYGLADEPTDHYADCMPDPETQTGTDIANDFAIESEGSGLEILAGEWEAIIGPETLFVGHNIERFDLQVLLGAWLRHDIEPPTHFPRLSHGRWYGQVYDTMAHLPNNQAGFVSLEDACQAIGLPTAKGVIWQGEPMTGKRVASAYEAGAYELLIEYCRADVTAEATLFHRLTNGRGALRNARSQAVHAALAPIWASDIDRGSKKIASFDALHSLGLIPSGIVV